MFVVRNRPLNWLVIIKKKKKWDQLSRHTQFVLFIIKIWMLWEPGFVDLVLLTRIFRRVGTPTVNQWGMDRREPSAVLAEIFRLCYWVNVTNNLIISLWKHYSPATRRTVITHQMSWCTCMKDKLVLLQRKEKHPTTHAVASTEQSLETTLNLLTPQTQYTSLFFPVTVAPVKEHTYTEPPNLCKACFASSAVFVGLVLLAQTCAVFMPHFKSALDFKLATFA